METTLLTPRRGGRDPLPASRINYPSLSGHSDRRDLDSIIAVRANAVVSVLNRQTCRDVRAIRVVKLPEDGWNREVDAGQPGFVYLYYHLIEFLNSRPSGHIWHSSKLTVPFDGSGPCFNSAKHPGLN